MTAVEEGQLAHEFVEAAVDREQIAQGRREQSGSPARPDEQGEMSKIAAIDQSLGDLIENVHCLFSQ